MYYPFAIGCYYIDARNPLCLQPRLLDPRSKTDTLNDMFHYKNVPTCKTEADAACELARYTKEGSGSEGGCT